MRWLEFDAFFRAATGHAPYPYQTKLVSSLPPALLHVPTGAGKTYAIFLSWLWRRRFHPDPGVQAATPRRLVYTLPMRSLVEQTRDTIQTCLGTLGLDGPDGVQIHVLMGGDLDDEWLLYPEQDAILIGTLDQLVSRALNRGYGMSRFRWPAAFGLLHNDALWVLDEVQLFGAALPTSAQLEGFRQKLGTVAPVQTVWMSATLQADWIATVDHPLSASPDVYTLTDADRANPDLHRRLTARKQIQQQPLCKVKEKHYAKELAAVITEHHQPGTLTLVMLNTVDRAVDVYKALAKHPAEKLLLHSRFRPEEREQQVSRLKAEIPSAGRIAVCTQVVEAGIDLSARTLITELAPWASLVQRFGRCNRKGEFDCADVLWLDVEEKAAAPYAAEDLTQSRKLLTRLEGCSVAPDQLPPCNLRQEAFDVIRHRDLIDLFDTTPDLSGNDIDVGRFVRVGDEYDLHVFWRDWAPGRPDKTAPAPDQRELCPVPLYALKDALKTGDREAWIWDHLDDQWRRVDAKGLHPGQVIMLRSADGGYDADLGWAPRSKAYVSPLLEAGQVKPEATGDDYRSFQAPQTLTQHTDQVVAELAVILDRLPSLAPYAEAMRLAARHHDLGKAHAVFQATMRSAMAGTNVDEATIWAKSGGRARRHRRRYFRHELASALALLQRRPDQFLAAYLAAAHHGRVRLAIRSMPDEERPPKAQIRFALGVWEGERLPAVDLGGGTIAPETVLDLSPMGIGGAAPTWLEQALALRDDPQVGPFRLAYLEAVIRAADGRASAGAGAQSPVQPVESSEGVVR